MKLLKADTINEVKDKFDKYFGNEATGCGELGNSEPVQLFQAMGRYLAKDIVSEENVPSFRRSVVDGYAVMAKDTFGVSETSPVFLEIVGHVEMGAEAEIKIISGQCVYVPTGGMLPEGADAVIMVEHTEMLDEKTISVNKAAAPNSGLMNVGDDYRQGQLIYKKGHRITIKDVGMLAALGHGAVEVFEKPVVSVISTGDEIVSVFESPGPGQVRDINSYTLMALLEETGAKVGGISVIKDSEKELKAALKEALDRSDIVILSGGSSAGDKDMTAEIIDSMGEPGVITHGLAMKPGKPTILGVVKDEKCCCCNRGRLAVGLPGHPMAAIMVYKIIVDYFIKKYYFKAEQSDINIKAQITENLHAGEGRETFTLVKLEKSIDEGQEILKAVPIHAKSGSISQLKEADGYVRIGDLSEGIRAGEMADITLLL